MKIEHVLECDKSSVDFIIKNLGKLTVQFDAVEVLNTQNSKII